VAVKIRLKRMGKIRAPFYRVVVMDSRTKRDGRAIEEIGKYHPTAEPSVIEIDSDRAEHWLKNGAQPTDAVAALLKVTGDWQRFKGLPGAEGTLKTAQTRKRAEKAAPAAKSAEPARGGSAAVGSDSEPPAGDDQPVPADTEAGDASVSGNPAEDPDPAPGNTEE
jgi:small subunit ribosomal protein S16